ncbi:phosphomannomutase/phosphoglucomutase [Rhodococcus rhodnii]|uniref:Phosphomannomutase n=2 Tax=Rhodococcus rhodnii TaxID=38312 RepID=R7WJB3_9NOCA|nr:phosphomannomutase/phosphoglucomutase [Rhodococcus rhodnii]EOM75376.1 phosphomannomutase [Rhodococcus rhodnii LMG 5362]TXG90579.1 phosphomannomutase/phosphoglucomutase [Rhodococcus rhodnii]
MSRSAESVHSVVKAYDVRGLVGEQLDEGFVRDLGGAFAHLMRSEGAARVAVGHDMRDSSPTLAHAFAEGVTAQGLDVVLLGLTSTDELYFASGRLECPGAMFTASHNPARYNGVKMCRAFAKPVGQQTGLADIAQQLVDGVAPYDGARGDIAEADLLADYAEFLRSLVDLSELRPTRIVVDAGNGMGGMTAPAVFGPLAAVTIDPLYFELDGTFPNHEANPLDPANLVDLSARVRETGADLGLAFDGDADRCFVVDEKGDVVSPSAITALVAQHALAAEPGATIIYNAITSRAVPELVEEWGGVAVRTRVGHSFIKQQMSETGAVFGGEHSGHYYFRDFWNADSGMLAALHVLAAYGAQDRPLSELMAEYVKYADSGEINSTVDDLAAAADEVVAAFAERTVAVDTLDGVTVDLGDHTWFNLRPSNTEPLLRLNAEAPSRGAVDAVVGEILGIVRGRLG